MDGQSEFVASPIYDNWFKEHYPKKSLLICSPYIKKDALERVLSLFEIEKRSDIFDLRILLRGRKEEFTFQNSSDISAFDALLALNGYDISNVKRIENLHMKAYLVDGTTLLITSGNLTNSGLFVVTQRENFEGGIATTDPKIISQFLQYFDYIWSQGQKLDDFYDELIGAYEEYIEKDYSDTGVYQRLCRQEYRFPKRSNLSATASQEPAPQAESPIANPSNSIGEDQSFYLSDIPYTGQLEYFEETLKAISGFPDGVSYIDLGKCLRPLFGRKSGEAGLDPKKEKEANKKFGEEKSKYVAFFDLAIIKDDPNDHKNRFKRKLVKITQLGKTYLKLSEDERNNLLKDRFFGKPIVVSILKAKLENDSIKILDYLMENCKIGTKDTLSRKANTLEHLFEFITSICTESELKEALMRI